MSIDKHKFYFETPLYELIKFAEIEGKIFEGDVDAYSAKNKFDTTYSIDSDRMGNYVSSNFYFFYQVALTCKRRGSNDVLKFFIYTNDEGVMKVGQEPSLADIQFAEIGKKYDKYLSRDELKEFKKAIGLASYGVGAGSFVYLRRIFENLINQTYKKYKEKVTLDGKDFKTLRMVDKIELLKNFLPTQLVDMKTSYSILSLGVHELSEEDCLKYFPVLKLSIELILEEQIELESKKIRDKEVRDALQEITQNINKQGGDKL
ncbi:MAG: hypothetical protein Q7K54_02285 [Candidatus Parcubacteria bacterium]|nr:hypothetical protein [Candidatus Parcubacteria bacterium]